MIAFIVIGIAGLALLLLSLLVGEIVDLGDGAVSGRRSVSVAWCSARSA